MRITETEKKRRHRDRKRRGRRVIQIEIGNWEAWGEILSAKGMLLGSVVNDNTVRLATETFVWRLCRDHSTERAQQELAEYRSPVTGLADRETGPYPEWRVIKSKDLQPSVEIDPDADDE